MNIDAPGAARGWRPANLVSISFLSIAMGYVAVFAVLLFRHSWIVDAGGRPYATDFLEVWVAGRTTLSGTPAAAYDWQAHHAAQALAVGHPFHGYLAWNYPPLFLGAAVFLATLPYVAAFLTWLAATGAAYVATIGAIAGRREAILVACATPAVLFNCFPGQNGFLTAALMGSALLFLDRRPFVSGVFLGLMTYKPQFGILFPIILACAGHWRAIVSATVTALVAVAVSWFAFGAATYRAFFHFLPVLSHSTLTQQGESWAKIQSVYAIARTLGGGDSVAWIAQGAATLACLGVAIWLWRRSESVALKAAGLVAAAMLAMPYLHVYDFPVLIVALAFLYRDRPFDRIEWQGAAAVNLLLLCFLLEIAPIGPGIVLVVLALVLRRAGLAPTLVGALDRWSSRARLRLVHTRAATNSRG